MTKNLLFFFKKKKIKIKNNPTKELFIINLN